MPDPNKPNAADTATIEDPNLDPNDQTQTGDEGDPNANDQPGTDANADGTASDTDGQGQDAGITDRFRRLGLDKRFADPVVALSSIPEKDREIERLRRDNAKVTDLLNTALTREPAAKKEEPKPFDVQAFRDKLDEDPLSAIEEAASHLGFVKKSEVDPKLKRIEGVLTKSEQAVADRNLVIAVGLHPELANIKQLFESGIKEPPQGVNEVWDEMTTIINDSPEFGRAIDEGRGYAVVDQLVVLAKDRLTKRKRPSVRPVSPGTKESAKTTSGARHPGGSALPDYSKMSADEIFKDQRKRGMVK